MRVTFSLLVFVLLSFGMAVHAQVVDVPVPDDGCMVFRTVDGKFNRLCKPHLSSKAETSNRSATRSAVYISERWPYISATQPDCKQYPLWTWHNPDNSILGYSCLRKGSLTWFVVGEGWDVQIPTSIGPSPTGGGVQFGISVGAKAPIGIKYDQLVGGSGGIQTLWVGTTYAGSDGTSDILDISGAGACDITDGTITCHQIDGMAAGSLDVKIYAPDVPTLEAASAQLIYSHKENGWRLSVPPAYDDEAANERVFSFSETLISKKPDNPYAYNSSFAVLNHSAQPQAVEVSVYDTDGNLIFSKSTPVLVGGLEHPIYPIVFPKGVYAEVFEPFFGESMFPQFGLFTKEFNGTIRFKGSGGGPISVVELQFVGRSGVALIGKAVKQ